MAVLDVLGSPAAGSVAGGLTQGILAGEQQRRQQAMLELQQQGFQLRREGQEFQQQLQTQQEQRQQELQPLRVRGAELGISEAERKLEQAPPEFVQPLQFLLGEDFDPVNSTRQDVLDLARLASVRLRQQGRGAGQQTATMLAQARLILNTRLQPSIRRRAELMRQSQQLRFKPKEKETVDREIAALDAEINSGQQQLDTLGQVLTMMAPEMAHVFGVLPRPGVDPTTFGEPTEPAPFSPGVDALRRRFGSELIPEGAGE